MRILEALYWGCYQERAVSGILHKNSKWPNPNHKVMVKLGHFAFLWRIPLTSRSPFPIPSFCIIPFITHSLFYLPRWSKEFFNGDSDSPGTNLGLWGRLSRASPFSAGISAGLFITPVRALFSERLDGLKLHTLTWLKDDVISIFLTHILPSFH